MSTQDEVKKLAGELVKRYGAAHKASIAKVAHHLNLAKSAHAKGMSRLAKAADCMVKLYKVGGAIDIKKDGGDMAGHMAAAHDHFSDSAAHMDDAAAHVGAAMSAWGHDVHVNAGEDPGGAITLPSLSELTEGGGPWYDSSEEYGEKVAKTVSEMIMKSLGLKVPDKTDDVTKALAALAGKGGDGGSAGKEQTFTKAQVDEMVKQAAEAAATKAENEALKKQVEVLQRMPAGAPKVKIFDFDKSALPGIDGGKGEDNAQRLGKLVEGVDFNIQDEGDFTKAGATMIANMIKNGPKFGQSTFGKAPMWDPSFHGRGGTGARN